MLGIISLMTTVNVNAYVSFFFFLFYHILLQYGSPVSLAGINILVVMAPLRVLRILLLFPFTFVFLLHDWAFWAREHRISARRGTDQVCGRHMEAPRDMI